MCKATLVFGLAELVCAKLADMGLFDLWVTIKLVSGSLGLILIAEWHRSPSGKVVMSVATVFCTLLLLPKVNMLSFNEDPVTLAVPTLKFELDPHRMEDIQSMFLNQQLYRSLFRFSSDGTVRGELIDRAEWSDDRKTLRLKIKEGERFSDGTPITSTEVVASLKRPFLIGSSIAADLTYFKGAASAIERKNPELLGLRTAGPHGVVIELERPSDLISVHLALPDLAILKIRSPHDELPSVRSGPYAIRFRDQDELLMESWDMERAGLHKAIRLRRIGPGEAFSAAIAGKVDSIEQYALTDEQIKELKERGWHQAVHSLSYENFLLMNPRRISRPLRELIASLAESDSLVRDLGRPSFKRLTGLCHQFLRVR
ncbi:MAG: hypothetical protein HC902_03745 [Calothrix sp. SM1_5_4]|nr:hypothetical protein [Calothrix sp. SM1_5_4]